MDFLGYIANGGLERLLIIGVATLIGYWGYRIYGRSQTPGLALIALAAVVLFSVILTSKQHLQSMNANLLAVASLTPPAASIDNIQPALVERYSLPETTEESAQTQGPATGATESPFQAAETPVGPSALGADDAAAETATGETFEPATIPRVERLVPLASGQELGGRITSVRSENLTLEWTTDPDPRRIILTPTPE